MMYYGLIKSMCALTKQKFGWCLSLVHKKQSVFLSLPHVHKQHGIVHQTRERISFQRNIPKSVSLYINLLSKTLEEEWLFISFQNPSYMSINNANTAKIAFKLHLIASRIHPLHRWFCHSLSPDFLLSAWTSLESPIVMMWLCGDYYALNQTGQPSSWAQIPSQAG